MVFAVDIFINLWETDRQKLSTGPLALWTACLRVTCYWKMVCFSFPKRCIYFSFPSNFNHSINKTKVVINTPRQGIIRNCIGKLFFFSRTFRISFSEPVSPWWSGGRWACKSSLTFFLGGRQIHRKSLWWCELPLYITKMMEYIFLQFTA